MVRLTANRGQIQKPLLVRLLATDIPSDTFRDIIYMAPKALQDVESWWGRPTGMIFDNLIAGDPAFKLVYSMLERSGCERTDRDLPGSIQLRCGTMGLTTDGQRS